MGRTLAYNQMLPMPFIGWIREIQADEYARQRIKERNKILSDNKRIRDIQIEVMRRNDERDLGRATK